MDRLHKIEIIMKTLYLLCGMPFSGKTTLTKFVSEFLDSSYISLDEMVIKYSPDRNIKDWTANHFTKNAA
jgi:shikimate kinase